MDFLLSAMHKGGPFMWPILLFSLVGLVVPVGLGLLSSKGKRVPAVLWVLVPGTVLLTGLLGTVQGLDQASEAVAHTSDSVRSTMAHAGMSVALFTQLTGATLAAALLVLAGWAAGLSGLRGGDGAKASWLGAGAVAGVVILGGLGCLALSIVTNSESGFVMSVGAMLLPCGLYMAAASLFSGGSEANHARLAEGRLTASLCLLFSVGAAGIAVITWARLRWHEIHAHTSAVSRQTFLEDLGNWHGLDELGAMVWCASLAVAALAALAAIVPVIGGLRNGRIAFSLAGVLLGVLCWVGLADVVDGQMEGLSVIAKEVPSLPH